MDEYYLFSFISNKLMIMRDFINDSFNKSVVTLFTIFSLQDNFQIEDLIIKSANSEIRWNKKWRFCGWYSEQMEKNLENLEHGFCPERAQLSSIGTVCPNSACTGRNAGFFEHDFLRFAVAAVLQISAANPNSSCFCWRDEREYIFLLIIWLESTQIYHVVIIYALIFLYLNETKDQRRGDFAFVILHSRNKLWSLSLIETWLCYTFVDAINIKDLVFIPSLRLE